MTSKDDKPTAQVDDEVPARLSYWDALVFEGFVSVQLPRRVIVRDGYPEVPLTRYRKEQCKNGS